MPRPLEIKQRSKVPIVLRFKDTAGVAIDITGSTVYFTVKRIIDQDETDADAVIKKDITVHSDPLNGLTGFTPTQTESDQEAGPYQGDVWRKTAAGTELLPSESFDVQFIAPITRRAT